MKHIVTLKPREKLELNLMEKYVREARNSNDYIKINFGRKREFIEVSFNKDLTYCIGFNFWNAEFQQKTNIFLSMYKTSYVNPIALYLVTHVNRLNR